MLYNPREATANPLDRWYAQRVFWRGIHLDGWSAAPEGWWNGVGAASPSASSTSNGESERDRRDFRVDGSASASSPSSPPPPSQPTPRGAAVSTSPDVAVVAASPPPTPAAASPPIPSIEDASVVSGAGIQLDSNGGVVGAELESKSESSDSKNPVTTPTIAGALTCGFLLAAGAACAVRKFMKRGPALLAESSRAQAFLSDAGNAPMTAKALEAVLPRSQPLARA